jgi:hypothetical protein
MGFRGLRGESEFLKFLAITVRLTIVELRQARAFVPLPVIVSPDKQAGSSRVVPRAFRFDFNLFSFLCFSQPQTESVLTNANLLGLTSLRCSQVCASGV